MLIDQTSTFGSRVLQRLAAEEVAWLITVDGDGTPQPSPIWFLWDEVNFLIYSQPDKPKLRNIARNPHVAINFDSNGRGGDIIVFTGTAWILAEAPSTEQAAAYFAKYDAAIARIGFTPASFAATYSIPIRVVPAKLRGH